MFSVSVIMPAARLAEQAQQVVDQVRKSESVTDVVVSSPYFELDRATCIRDAMVGSARAVALAYQHTNPETTHVAWLSDICLPAEFALDAMVYFVAEQKQPFIAEFRTLPPVTVGHYRVCTILGKQYARWGMLSRDTIKAIGGFFDEAYVAHYGDVDLSLRCWKAGGSVATCTNATMEMHGHWHVSTAPQSADEALFLERWKNEYPTMRRDNTAEWNVDREMPL